MPIKEIQGKSKEGITEVIKNHIVDSLMADAAARQIAEDGGIDAEAMEKIAKLANDPMTVSLRR